MIRPFSGAPTRRRFLVSAVAASLVARAMPALAAPRAEPWTRWAANDPASRSRVDHGAWSAFLARHVATGADGIARLDYGSIPPADRDALGAYLKSLSATDVDGLARDEQKAFWINFYNALTVATVLAHYPVASIRDIAISPGWFSVGPWGAKLVEVAGEPLSLDDIEHRILRPLWGDARLHYALNCAALGCPNLRAEAWTAKGLDAALDAAARAYVNHPRGARVERGRLFVSSLYVWYGRDFGADDGDVIDHIRRFAAPELVERLEMIDQISGHSYDWGLNDAGGVSGG